MTTPPPARANHAVRPPASSANAWRTALRMTLMVVLPSATLAWPMVSPARAQVAGRDRDTVLEQQRRMREQQFKSYQNNVAGMPKLDKRTLDEVLQMRMENKHLTCTSPLADSDTPLNGQYRIEVEPFKGPTYVQLVMNFNGFRPGARPAGPQRTLSLISYDLPTPDSFSTLSVNSNAGTVQVARTTSVGDGSRTVRIIDQRDADTGNGLAQLFVNEYGAAFPNPRNLNLGAADFHTLLREHPREAEELIRPLMRNLGQEAVFAPDVLVAWQVFADGWKPDESAVDRINKLLPLMNSADYRPREKAVGELEAMGRAGAAALLHLDRKGLTPQQNLLIDRALAPYAQLSSKEAERLGADRGFLLDCLYSPDRPIRAAALDRLKKAAGEDVPFDLEAPAPARTAAVGLLRSRWLAGPTTRAAGQ